MGQPELEGAIRAQGAQLQAKQQQGAAKDKRSCAARPPAMAVPGRKWVM
jgi:hypothetical protein